MTMKIDINRADIASVQLVLAGIKNGYPKVMTRSINKTIRSTKTFAGKKIAETLNLTQTRIKKDFREVKANWTKLSGRLDATGKPVGLISFSGTRQVKAGVSVRVHKNKPKSVIPHAFIATASRARNVWRRQYRGPRERYRPGFPYARMPREFRYPLERLTGPRIEDEYAKPAIIGEVTRFGANRFADLLEAETAYELSKHR